MQRRRNPADVLLQRITSTVLSTVLTSQCSRLQDAYRLCAAQVAQTGRLSGLFLTIYCCKQPTHFLKAHYCEKVSCSNYSLAGRLPFNTAHPCPSFTCLGAHIKWKAEICLTVVPGIPSPPQLNIETAIGSQL